MDIGFPGHTSADTASSPSTGGEPDAEYELGCSATTTGAPAGWNVKLVKSSVGSSDWRRRVIVADAPESRAAAGSAGRRRERTWRVQCRPVHSGPWSRASALAPACVWEVEVREIWMVGLGFGVRGVGFRIRVVVWGWGVRFGL